MKKKIRDLNPTACRGISTRKDEYKALLMNAVRIEGLDFPIERFVKSTLISDGRAGYDRMTDKWSFVSGEGVNDVGDPERLTFTFPNRTAYQRRASYKPEDDGAYMILSLPSGIAMGEIIEEYAELEEICDRAIRQNLKACQTPALIVVRDPDTRLSILHAIQEKEEGDPAVVISPDISEGLRGVSTETAYMVDKFAAFRDMERDRLLNKLGIMSANINKRERVQVGEVNATVGQCVDYIYLMIDTFNRQMDSYGLPFVMTMNGALEELYTNEEGDDENGELENDSVVI